LEELCCSEKINENKDTALLLKILKEYVHVPGDCGDMWWNSLSNQAFGYFYENNAIIPDEVMDILFDNLKTSDGLVRREVYENLGRAYKKCSKQNKEKILVFLNAGIDNEKSGQALFGAEQGISF